MKTNSNEKERIIIHVITLLTLEVKTFFSHMQYSDTRNLHCWRPAVLYDEIQIEDCCAAR